MHLNAASLHRRSVLVLVALLTLSSGTSAAEPDLTDLDLATLMGMDVTVTSASRRAQATSDAAAAVYVITREEIRRSGATSLPEVLRLAPGVQVARISSRSWAVTTRGFNSRYATKLLVMVDGRSVYTPLFSGVIWEEQNVFLDEIERVEVVRGPGGALWGINAVNGVINIITRNAGESKGLMTRADAGPEVRTGALSYGGSADGIGDYRFFVERDEQESIEIEGDELTRTQVGGRLDREFASGNLNLQADFSRNYLGLNPQGPAASLSNSSDIGHVSAGWQRQTAAGHWDLRSYYSWADRDVPGRWNDSTFGFDAQFSAERIGRHLLTAGVGYLYSRDHFDDDMEVLALTPAKVQQYQWSMYAQDEVHFLDDTVRLIAGAKIENLKFTGVAFEPTLRGLWHVNSAHTVWAAASRAVRTPSRIELHSQMQFGNYSPYGSTLMRLTGEPELDAEDLYAYELGWRWRPLQTLSFDVAAYRNDYKGMISGRMSSVDVIPELPPTVIFNGRFDNLQDTRVSGLEIAAEWAAQPWLRFQAQTSLMDAETCCGMSSGSPDPDRMFTLRAAVDLPHDVQLDLSWRAVSELDAHDIEAYDSLNARIAWSPTKSLELSLTADNLLNNEHLEFENETALAQGVSIGRSVFGRVTWRPRH